LIKANPSAQYVTTLMDFGGGNTSASKKPTIKDSKFQNEIVEHVGGW
jgi:hypothetical protein